LALIQRNVVPDDKNGDLTESWRKKDNEDDYKTPGNC